MNRYLPWVRMILAPGGMSLLGPRASSRSVAREGVDLVEDPPLHVVGRQRRPHRRPRQVGDPASSSPSRSAATSYSWLRVVPNIGGSSELTVTVTPGVDERRQRVLVERRRPRGWRRWTTGTPPAGCRLGRQVREQRGVLGGGGAVPDPLGAQQPRARPRSSRAGGLAGVRHAVQPGRPRGVEVRLELRPVDADLGAAEAEADQRLGRVVERVVAGSRRPPGTPNSPGMS